MNPRLYPILAGVLLCLSVVLTAQSAKTKPQKKLSPAAARMQQKLDHIEQNAKAKPIDTRPTQLNENEVNASRRNSNPLLSMFRGSHEVAVTTHARGSGGQGLVHVDSVTLDGVEVPQFVLQLYVDRYLKPKYPNVGLDSEFKMPDRIDTATVGNHYVVLTQK